MSPPDDQTSVPGPSENSSSKDIDFDAASHRQNIRLTREADMPPDDEPEDSGPSPPHHGSSADDPDRDETSSSPQARKKRRVDDSDDSEVIVTLGEAKYWVYTVLGQQACPLPPVRRQSLAPILMHRIPDEEPDYSAPSLSRASYVITGLFKALIPSSPTPMWIVANGGWPRLSQTPIPSLRVSP